MKVLLVTVVTLTTAIILCAAADLDCIQRKEKGLPPHWPDPTDCTRFYRCTTKNVKREVICPTGREYNQKTGKCALSGKGVCKLSLMAPLTDDGNVCQNVVSGTYLPKTGYCQEFYICENNAAFPQTCNLGSIFLTSESACVPDETTACWQNKCNNVKDGTYLPDSTSCLNFYVCGSNKVTVQTCNSGSYFDMNTRNCVPDTGNLNCWENFCLNEPDGVNIPNAADCHSYYKCNAKTALQQQCQDGYYFDKDTLACKAGACPDEICTCPGGYQEGEFVPHPSDCNSFYICSNSQLIEQHCPYGNYFDCYSMACVEGNCLAGNKQEIMKRSLLDADNFHVDTEDNDDVIATSIEKSKSDDTMDLLQTSETVNNETNESTQVGLSQVQFNAELTKSNETIDTIESTKTEAALEFMCMDRYFEGDIIADPDNCQQFKICYNAELMVQSCGSGSYFDEDLLICMTDVDGACSRKLAPVIEEITPTGGDCVCPGNIQPGQSVPNLNSCSSFYICNGDSGLLEEQNCGTGNYYNSQTQCCELDTTGFCWKNTEGPCTCPGDIQPGELVPYPDPENCNLYYICDGDNGQLVLTDCGVGNRFDNDTKTCVPDTCGICNIPANICDGQPNNTPIANPTKCNSFYLCLTNNVTLHVCDPGNWFDPAKGACVLDTDGQCINPCANSTGIEFLPHPSCTKFYFCNDGKATVESCDANTSFDPQLKLCTPGLGNCGSEVCAGQPDDKTFPVADDNTKFYLCQNGVGVIRQCLEGTTYDATFGICRLLPSDYCDQPLCKGAEEGLVSPTTDNRNASFCVCRGGSAYLMPCNEGYLFDPKKLICYTDAQCDPAICRTSPDFTHFPTKNMTNTFCMCLTEEVIMIECPKNGTFNPSTMTCQLPVPQDPNCDPTKCLVYPEYKTFPTLDAGPNTANTSFCICMNGGATVLDCTPGHKFEEDYGICLSNTPPFDVTKCQSGEKFFPVPNNAYAFYYCSDANNYQMINCPSDTVYNDDYKACIADPCDQTVCEDPSNANLAFAAIGNPYIFCYCGPAPADSPNGLKAYWEACDVGTKFDPNYKVCLSENVNLDCDVKLCANYSTGMTIPAINDPYGFCYCTSKNTAEKFSCNAGMKYDPIRNICMDDLLCNGQYTQYETVANPSICNKYYFCYNGNLLDLTCPEGTYFDSKAMHCLPNDNNQCLILSDDCTCPGGYQPGEFQPHPTDCSLYYICMGGKLVESSCGTGNYYDKVTQSCQPDKTGCCPTSAMRTCVGNYREGQFVAHPTNAQSYYVCTNARLRAASCGEGNVFDRKSETCIRSRKVLNNSYKWKRTNFEMQDFMCLEGQKRSVPANCSQYELCRNGLWKRSTCSEYTYYNPEQQLCLEPRDDTVCAYAKIPGLPVCNEQKENTLIPSKTGYCGSYLRCGRGKWRSKNCPKQQYFDNTLQTCITSSSNDTNQCHSIEQNRTLNAMVPSDRCMHTQVRIYERNCAMYFMCLEGEWWFQYCPLGMYFHPKQHYCVPNEAGQCPTAKLMLPQEEKLEGQDCVREGALRASAHGCEQFYVCVGGKWHLQTCAANQYFNVAQETCVPDDGTCKSITNGEAKKQCLEGSKRTYPLNCTAYELCHQGEWLRRDCMNHTVFDDVIGKCVPNDGSCSSNGLRRACSDGERKAHPRSSNCSEFYYCVGGNWQVGTCLKGYKYEPHVGACIAGTCNKIQVFDTDVHMETGEEEPLENPCAGKADGVAIPHPNNCGKFYLCYKGNTKEQSCTSGSYFDADTSYCRPNDGACEMPLTGPCEGQQNGTKVPNTNDCASYYLCSTIYGTQLYVCPEGEYYHTFTRQCRQDHGQCRKEPTHSVCASQEHGARLPHERYCNIYYACVRGMAVPIECPDDYKFNAVLRRCLPDEERECQNGLLVDGGNSTYSCGNLTDGTYVADKSDCTKYYICSGGYAQHQQCDKESFFDSGSLMCMPDDGSCPLVDNDKPNQKPVPPDPIVCIGKHGDLMPDPANCNNFYACINSKLRHERCYESHFFNITTYQCQVHKNDSDVIIEFDSSEELNQSATVIKQCTDKPTNFSSLCLEREDGASMGAHGDCRLYISCNEQQATSQRCRNGESYDSILGFCRQNDGTCQLENGKRVGVCSGKHGQLTRDVDNCRGYFTCINGQKIASSCAEDEYFSKVDNLCLKDSLKQCNQSAKTEDGLAAAANGLSCVGLRESTYYPYVPDQCRSYFQCLKGIAKLFTCSNGMYFDAVTLRCVNEKVQCTGMEKQQLAQQRFPAEKICANATIGQRYANKDDNCRSFYICRSNDSVSYENCPLGMLFSAESASCEAALLVKCSRN